MPWYECETCSREFVDQHAMNQHMDALDHWAPRYECETCDDRFPSQLAANIHMNTYGHWRWKCDTCTASFRSREAVDAHMTAHGHWEHWCGECRRNFDNAGNLKAHLNSRAHRGTTIACPFCQTAFVSASGVAHHVESGGCPRAKGANRQTVFNMLRQRDPNGLITNNLLEWNHTETWSSDRAWNGQAYECYLCHRGFARQSALDQHLGSPAHAQKVYHCPNGRCRREFVSLAALFNHLESESCRFVRFDQVQRGVGDMIAGNRMIAFN